MPEIKNNFTQGKMNKDLDERLIPNGEYRHAINVQVSTSEGADVGTVQNILGNKSIETLVPDNFKCIGSITDEKTNKIYWFVTTVYTVNPEDPKIDAILEYENGKLAVPVIVDKKAETADAVLKFTKNIITGINIVDDMLLWTDNVNEPRKININRCKIGTDRSSNNLTTTPHTKLVVDDTIATNKFTTIASADINAAAVTLNDASELTAGMTLVSIDGVYQTNIVIDSIDSNTVTLSAVVTLLTADEVIFSSPVDIIEDHITVIKKKPTTAPTIKINTSTETPKPTLFEKILGRFAYRYKYEDGEYSAFGPFTTVVFDPKYTEGYDVDTAFSVKEPYNVAMLNSIESIELTDFISTDIPRDVVQIDILYKQEDSPNVYSLANVKKDDSAWTADGSNQQTNFTSNNKGKYTVESENIYAVVPQNQTLRSWDNVPKRALAQEITGNRVVYGNYIQNYSLGLDSDRNPVKPTLTVDYGLRNNINNFADGGLPSIKSQRNYQLGVVFGDKYGRETPVYTSTNAAVRIPWLDDRFGRTASNSLQLKTNLTSSIPEWSNYYKFFIKETSGEYYNLIMDKAYNPTSDTEDDVEQKHIWVSFPSSDRNKISEETYLILKKRVGAGEGQVQYENRFKIIDVKNEAPDAIKYKFYSLGAVDNATGILHDATGSGIMPNPDRRIDKETDRVDVNKNNWLDSIMAGSNLLQGEVYEAEKESIYISWRLTSGGTAESSKRYKVVQVDTSGSLYKIKLAEKIFQKDALIAHDSSDLTDGGNLHTDLLFRAERKQLKDTEEFSGKFFIKIVSDATTGLNIEQDGTNDLLDGLVTTAQQDMFRWVDAQATTDIWTDGIINADFLGAGTNTAAILHGLGGNITETQEKWAVLETFSKSDTNNGKFFIDNMYFVAGQNSSENYAKNVGDIVRGTTTSYQAITWSDVAILGVAGGLAAKAATLTNALGYRWWPVDTMVHPTTTYFNSLPFNAIPHPNPYPNAASSKDETKAVNGMEGIIVTGDEHTKDDADGVRTWRKEGPLATLDNTENLTYEFDDTYGVEGDTGRYFIHLSFMAPGDDLVPDAMDITNARLKGPESLGTHLQGIWGGGVFCRADGYPFVANMHPYTITSGTVPSTIYDRVIELEGHYNSSPSNISWDQEMVFGGYGSQNITGAGTAPWTTLSTPPGPNSGQGYNQAYAALHENQWNPAYPASRDPFFHIRDFVANMHVGAKFKFSDDTSNIIYKIKSVKIKKLYNHTPWRRRKIYTDTLFDGTSVTTGWHYARDSVEWAAVNWANEMNAGTNLAPAPDETGGASGGPNEAWDLQEKIKDFGRANNRRVCYIIEVDKDPSAATVYNPIGAAAALDADSGTKLQFIESDARNFTSSESSRPAIWETEPKKSADLDIYYETGNIIPTKITNTSREIFAPVGCRVEFIGLPQARNGAATITEDIYLTSWDKDVSNAFVVDAVGGNSGFNAYADTNGGTLVDYEDTKIRFYKKDGSYTTATVEAAIIPTSTTPIHMREFKIKSTVDPDLEVGLNWSNCFSFGNGVESDRIRDGYNEAQISNGAKASSTTEEPYQEEHRKYGLIYSGLYNSNSGINDLNQFIMAEKITKDLNPTFGSIQKLFQRRTSLVTFCEDRVISVLSNRDALYNADGNPQLISSSAVLGDATPFIGDYGISKNPESFAKESYRVYFADKQRGAILRLSKDGLTPISDLGMHDWFRDNLTAAGSLIGTYDEYKKDYNLTLTEHLASNLLINTTEGEEVEEITNLENLIINGTINSGTSFLMPAVIAPENDFGETTDTESPYISTPSSFWMDIDNEELNTETTTVNHPAITAGYLEPGVTEVIETIPFVPPEFEQGVNNIGNNSYISTGYTLYSVNFKNLGLVNPFETLTGSPLARVRRKNYTGGHNSSAYVAAQNNPSTNIDGNIGANNYVNYTIGPNQNLYIAFGNGDVTSNNNRGNVYYNPDSSPGGYLGIIFQSITNICCRLGRGNYWSTTASTESAGASWLEFPRDYNNDNVNVPTDVLTTYSAAKNNTIFNGEEIEIQFDVNTKQLDTSYTSAVAGWEISLWDGNTQVSDSLIYDPGTAVASITNPYTETLHTPTVSNTGVDRNLGFQSTAEKRFDNIARNNQRYWHKVYFKFNDSTSDEKILVNNLVVRLRLKQAGVTENNFTVGAFSIRKIWRLKTPEVPEILNQITTIGVPMAPPVDIPAWTEVTHEVISGWSSSSPGVDLHAKASNTYGALSTGAGLTQAYHIENPNPSLIFGIGPILVTPGYLIPPTFDLAGSIASTTATWFDNNNDTIPDVIPDLSSTVTDDTHETNDSFYINSIGNTDGKAYITQDLGSKPLETDKWYLVDIYYEPDLDNDDTDDNPEQGSVAVYGVLDSAAATGYPSIDIRTGYVGEVYESGSSPTVKSMQLIPVIKTSDQYGSGVVVNVTPASSPSGDNVLRAVFQVHPNSYINGNNSDGPSGSSITYLDTLKLEFTDFKGQIDKIVVLDVSESSTSGTADNWNTPVGGLNQGVDNNSFHTPILYWKSNKFNFGRSVRSNVSDYNLIENIKADENSLLYQNGPFVGVSATGAETHAGYEFKFTISKNTDTNSLLGSLNSYVTSDFGGFDDFEGFYITGIDTEGDYTARVNFDGNGGYNNQGTLLSLGLKLNNTDHGTISSYSAAGLDTSNAAVANRVAFMPDATDEFMGAVNQISLIDLTSFFTGGASNAWAFTGFDTAYYNYITFDVDDQTIQFIDAPINHSSGTDPVQVEQYIPQLIGNKEYYRVRFDFSDIEPGTLNGYYFNSAGEGFRLKYSISGDGRYDESHQIGEATATIGEKRNTFVIFVETVTVGVLGTPDVPGILKNIEMLREYPLYSPKTLTYNEMVKGWVSFKSFILEHGNSVAKKYFTMKNGKLYEHHVDLEDNRNTFYGTSQESSLTAILNESPSSIKIFNTLNYEGSQSKILQYNTSHLETLKPYNKSSKKGWYVESIKTDKQLGALSEFIEKEGKWFNYIKGDVNDIKTSDFSFQGLGTVSAVGDN